VGTEDIQCLKPASPRGLRTSDGGAECLRQWSPACAGMTREEARITPIEDPGNLRTCRRRFSFLGRTSSVYRRVISELLSSTMKVAGSAPK
jgi:hypothetical protein